MVGQKRLDFIRISFLIAGHTKFSPDLVFAKIAQTYNRSDVFCTEDLKQVIAAHAEVVVDEGEIVHDWWTNLTKYSKLPGICSLHDFVFTVSASTNWCAKLGNYATLVPLTMLQFMYKQAEVNLRMSFQILRRTTQV